MEVAVRQTYVASVVSVALLCSALALLNCSSDAAGSSSSSSSSGGGGSSGGTSSGEPKSDSGAAGEPDAEVSTDAGVDSEVVPDAGSIKFVFVTKDTFAPNFKSEFPSAVDAVDAADKICNRSAASAGLKGTYRAWLSTSTVNALYRLPVDGSWYSMGYELAFPNRTVIANGPLKSIAFDESRKDIKFESPADVWTGTIVEGTKHADTCSNWTSILAAQSGRVGTMTGTGTLGYWTSNFSTACNKKARLYCFGI